MPMAIAVASDARSDVGDVVPDEDGDQDGVGRSLQDIESFCSFPTLAEERMDFRPGYRYKGNF